MLCLFIHSTYTDLMAKLKPVLSELQVSMKTEGIEIFYINTSAKCSGHLVKTENSLIFCKKLVLRFTFVMIWELSRPPHTCLSVAAQEEERNAMAFNERGSIYVLLQIILVRTFSLHAHFCQWCNWTKQGKDLLIIKSLIPFIQCIRIK